MKYNLTSKWGVFVCFCLFFISITSQSSLKVQISGDTASYSGGTYQFTAPSKQDFYLNIEAHNISATDTFLLYVTCVELNTLNGWADGFCWAHLMTLLMVNAIVLGKLIALFGQAHTAC